MSARQFLGHGVLTWSGAERRSDRYGSVWLMVDGTEEPSPLRIPQGRGKLVAEVLEGRDSSHVGDLFRGIKPSTPKDGEVLILGSGQPFLERSYGMLCIGCKPDDGRASDWLDPNMLYHCHDSLVRLFWEPEGA